MTGSTQPSVRPHSTRIRVERAMSAGAGLRQRPETRNPLRTLERTADAGYALNMPTAARSLARWRAGLLGLLCAASSGACSASRLASNAMAETLAKSGDVFASDDDPELVGQALPFTLKLMESLLASSPDHERLLIATTRAFTQYAYAFVQMEGDRLELDDYAAAKQQHERAKRLYLRARGYGLRALALAHAGFEARLRAAPGAALNRLDKTHIEALYWTCAAWAGAISLSKDDPLLLGEVPLVERMLDRAFALDPDFEQGALHSFMMAFESARVGEHAQGGEAGRAARARKHFERAVELSGGASAGPFVSWAESYSVANQDLAEFRDLLERALAIDPDRVPGQRLVNVLMQRRARWLLDHTEDLFLLSTSPSEPSTKTP